MLSAGPAKKDKFQGLLLVLILFSSLVLNLMGIRWGPEHYSWAVDSLQFSPTFFDGLSENFSGTWRSKYPVFIHILVGLAYLPFLVILWGRGDLPEFTAHLNSFDLPIDYWVDFNAGIYPFTFYPYCQLAGRLFMVLLGTATVYLLFRIGQNIHSKAAGLIAAGLTAFYYPHIFYSHTTNTEVPLFFFSFLAIYFFTCFRNQHALRYAGFMGAAGALALGCKEQAVFILLFLPLALLVDDVKQRRFSYRNSGLLRCAALFLVMFTLSNNLIFNLGGFLDRLKWIFSPIYYLKRDKIYDFSTSLFLTPKYTFQMLSQSSSTLLISLGLLALVYGAVKKKLIFPLAAFCGYFFLLVIPVAFKATLWLRHLMPLYYLLGLALAWFLVEWWRHGRARMLVPLILALAFSPVLWEGLTFNRLLRDGPRVEAEQWLKESLGRDDKILCFGSPMIALPVLSRRDYPNLEIYRNFYDEAKDQEDLARFFSGYYDCLIYCQMNVDTLPPVQDLQAHRAGALQGNEAIAVPGYQVRKAFTPTDRHPAVSTIHLQPHIYIYEKVQ